MSNALSFFLQLTICSLLARFSLYMFSAFIPKSARYRVSKWINKLCDFTLQGMEDLVTSLFSSKEESEEVEEVVATSKPVLDKE